MANKWDFPVIKSVNLIPDWLIAWRRALPEKAGVGATHFFLDDFRFESIWNNPKASFALLKTEVILSPDFSLYRDWPLALQIWNTYRNRWCGAFWQSHGYKVIPTVSWSVPESYEFCFDGIEPGGVVAIGTVGLEKDDGTRSYFHAGFIEMITRLNPRAVLCYGEVPTSVIRFAKIISYPTFWKKKRR